MRIIRFDEESYQKETQAVIHRLEMDFATQDATVQAILQDVKEKGDEALLEYTRKFDGHTGSLQDLRVTPEEIKTAYSKMSAEEIDALKIAAENIRSFHEKQKQESWEYSLDGIRLGQKVSPLRTAGIYVPGGKASYPSSVLMNAIPAKVAGVERIVMCTPCPGGQPSWHALVAADLAGVDEIYKVGGAQAIGAMAFGSTLVPRVDKIVGPGNIFVALAKRMVFGIVGIDMVAGPSEILIVADDTANPEYIAADLLSQAEHDEEAVSILTTPSQALAEAALEAVNRQKERLKRGAIVDASLKNQCRLFVTESLEAAVQLADEIAPEHLELAVDDPVAWAAKINNAGAIFMGHYTPEAIGDYLAGPNHVLPTSGTARFSSPLGVYDFIKRTSLITYSQEALQRASGTVQCLADMENLDAHANAVKVRLK
ncbi:MAG: histidinol dehydrogenase [Candidatus Nitrohelix vancouverensis]|uniref:Histidinol dehydrogenase n=1 Tax=Candidatus Nitrohelix vancouverensis TaxID=2705534 RepID=A0A7T0G3N2_9BACT|nr:MAG: histidinol dehydrogenase [Candidatus Nitrohelix vancouverensis]